MLRLTPVRKLSRVRYTVLGWGVDDIASIVGALTAVGVAFVSYRGMEVDAAGIWTSPGGDRVAWFEDPDGNLLSLTQLGRASAPARAGPAPQARAESVDPDRKSTRLESRPPGIFL